MKNINKYFDIINMWTDFDNSARPAQSQEKDSPSAPVQETRRSGPPRDKEEDRQQSVIDSGIISMPEDSVSYTH